MLRHFELWDLVFNDWNDQKDKPKCTSQQQNSMHVKNNSYLQNTVEDKEREESAMSG